MPNEDRSYQRGHAFCISCGETWLEIKDEVPWTAEHGFRDIGLLPEGYFGDKTYEQALEEDG